VVELKAMVFKTLCGWIVALNSSRFSNFVDLCSSSSP
jgi:hypothetical protein